jgi:glycosyltransferase involved in cell wall biosynthesis
MRIAQVAPLIESVPPKMYGGTERVVSFLTEELVRLGHDVTLFASSDSQTSATLAASCDPALRLKGCQDFLPPHVLLAEQVAQRADEFDVIHFHIGPVHFPVVRRLAGVAHVTTLHGRLDSQELQPLFMEFSDVPVVSISNAQRRPLPAAAWIDTIYHGLPLSLFDYCEEPHDYFAFVGRMSPEKRVDRAIAIAKACGCPLRIAAKVDPADRAYFEGQIRPLLDDPLVEFIGEIGDDQKNDFVGHARALLFPIDWPEPFGLVMIEALACGVPVVAFAGGSVAEIIEDGVTGFVVSNLDDAIAAARAVETIDRRDCRAAFERRFSVSRMAARYLRCYRQLIAAMSNRVA